MNLLKGSAFLKIMALVVAIPAYFYIKSEITRTEQKNVSDPSYKLIKLTAKSLPVKVRLETSAPEGYRVVDDKVSASPDHIVVIGPEALLESAQTAETGIVDVSETTKTINKKIPIESVAGIHLAGQSYTVDVTVPVEKIEKPAEKK